MNDLPFHLTCNVLASSSVSSPINILWTIPFVLLLACIALMPFINKHLWERHYAKVAIGLAALPALYYFVILRQPAPWLGAMEEYLSFIILLGSLYIISGGIVIRVNRKASPLANASLLLVGAIVANLFGTTGASMLLIRPFLRMNRGHLKPYHIVFFIFIVSNCGGMLTPIGDPPLFLGYLQGIPFRWTLDHLFFIWSFVIAALLIVFFVIDTIDHAAQARSPAEDEGPQMHILGIANFVFISGVLFAVFRPGFFDIVERVSIWGFSVPNALSLLASREVLMVAAAVVSRRATSAKVYQLNEFSYAPIREVAILFIGIFSTMAPALGWLGQNASHLPIKTPGQFYFTSGSLSSVLDNAPTYLTFLKMELGRLDASEVDQAKTIIDQMHEFQRVGLPARGTVSPNVAAALDSMVTHHRDAILDGSTTRDQVQVAFLLGIPSLNALLIAISAGSVLFGACTYIGNGPNFMVKSIAEASGAKTPGFLGYILCYTLPILLPIYVAVWLIFL